MIQSITKPFNKLHWYTIETKLTGNWSDPSVVGEVEVTWFKGCSWQEVIGSQSSEIVGRDLRESMVDVLSWEKNCWGSPSCKSSWFCDGGWLYWRCKDELSRWCCCWWCRWIPPEGSAEESEDVEYKEPWQASIAAAHLAGVESPFDPVRL